jgi:hypothetical protein
MEYLNLNNGTKIPAAGIGTFLMQPMESLMVVPHHGYVVRHSHI